MYGPSAKKTTNNGPCREVAVKEEVDVSSEVRPWAGGGGDSGEFWIGGGREGS